MTLRKFAPINSLQEGALPSEVGDHFEPLLLAQLLSRATASPSQRETTTLAKSSMPLILAFVATDGEGHCCLTSACEGKLAKEHVKEMRREGEGKAKGSKRMPRSVSLSS